VQFRVVNLPFLFELSFGCCGFSSLDFSHSLPSKSRSALPDLFLAMLANCMHCICIFAHLIYSLLGHLHRKATANNASTLFIVQARRNALTETRYVYSRIFLLFARRREFSVPSNLSSNQSVNSRKRKFNSPHLAIETRSGFGGNFVNDSNTKQRIISALTRRARFIAALSCELRALAWQILASARTAIDSRDSIKTCCSNERPWDRSVSDMGPKKRYASASSRWNSRATLAAGKYQAVCFVSCTSLPDFGQHRGNLSFIYISGTCIARLAC